MGFFSNLNPFRDDYQVEVDRFESAVRRNPDDITLKAQYAKFCLRHFFSHPDHPGRFTILEEIGKVDFSDLFDPEFFYLMGRYHHHRDEKAAKRFYLEGVRRFNHYVGKNPGLKQDHLEAALATALNLMTLQAGKEEHELTKFFKIVRKSYPLHIKHVEFESEMEKDSIDGDRVQVLKQEIEDLKAKLAAERANRLGDVDG